MVAALPGCRLLVQPPGPGLGRDCTRRSPRRSWPTSGRPTPSFWSTATRTGTARSSRAVLRHRLAIAGLPAGRHDLLREHDGQRQQPRAAAVVTLTCARIRRLHGGVGGGRAVRVADQADLRLVVDRGRLTRRGSCRGPAIRDHPDRLRARSAPYMHNTSDQPVLVAAAPAGSVVGRAASWPIDAVNDFSASGWPTRRRTGPSGPEHAQYCQAFGQPLFPAIITATGGSTTGGGLPAGNYYAYYTFVDSSGRETTVGFSQSGPLRSGPATSPRWRCRPGRRGRRR